MEDIERLKKLAGIDNLPVEDSMGENLLFTEQKKQNIKESIMSVLEQTSGLNCGLQDPN